MFCKAHRMTYKEYLDSPDWFITNLEVINEVDAYYDKQEIEKSKRKK